MKRCTRPDWSDEKNDWCICDDLEEFSALYDNSCEECVYWAEEEL